MFRTCEGVGNMLCCSGVVSYKNVSYNLILSIL